ncbi:hypothetical protein Y032_0232g3066 [Ancylostoma ceylanicum]|uniref:Protein-tyrosine phosphatase n=1 Tax=Ancylostoma ceylanicum TaxID=53326 RepID=A0A016SFS2_9BILA|nr:hypothetical protein Y032_0232g3066 [Ancylostoma ceylanicum]
MVHFHQRPDGAGCAVTFRKAMPRQLPTGPRTLPTQQEAETPDGPGKKSGRINKFFRINWSSRKKNAKSSSSPSKTGAKSAPTRSAQKSRRKRPMNKARKRVKASSDRKANRTKKSDGPKKTPSKKPLNLTPSAEQLLISKDEDEIAEDYMLTMAVDMMTTEGEAFAGKAQDPRLAWASMVLEQGALYIMKKFRKVQRFKPGRYSVAAFKANPQKNRYNDIQCIDETRVILRDHTSDYIHANWVTTPKGKKFICTQGPMPTTVSDFWHMILQEDCRTIIMLCRLEEDKKQKCVQYYPNKTSQPFLIDNTVVKLVKQKWSEELGVMTSVWNVKHREREFELRHIQYKNWPDHSAPKDSLGVLELHKVIKKNPEDHPVVIHCSAGVGRTCTLAGVEILLEQMRTLNFQSSITIVKTMRRSRLGAVQRAIQYLFMHLVVLEWLCQVNHRENVLSTTERQRQ